jgi:hypothetical protein
MYESFFHHLSDNLFGNDRCHFKNFFRIQHAPVIQARTHFPSPSLLSNIIRRFKLSILKRTCKVHGRSLQPDINIKFGCIFFIQ